MINPFLTAIAVVAAASAAHGQYVGSVVGVLPDVTTADSLTVNTGESFTGAVVLDASPGVQHDFALFRLVFSVGGLEHESDWFDWSSPYTTGGIDDFSSPGPSSSGTITQDTYVDAIEPSAIDVKFENLTDSFGEFFETGRLVTFTLTVPEMFELGEFTIGFVPDTFTAGISTVGATAGQGLTVNVIPAPGAFALLGGLGWMRNRRR